MTRDWIGRALRLALPVRESGGRKLERVAARIDARTETIAAALSAISEHISA